MKRWYEGRTSRIVFDDYTSEAFKVDGGLDQGNPASGISYLIYNSDLAEILNKKKSAGEAGVIYVDDNTMVATGSSYEVTHGKLEDMASRVGGVDEWEVGHNVKFGLAKYQLLDAGRRLVKDTFQPRKRKPGKRFGLMLKGYYIKSMPTVKLLGVHLDRELRWGPQGAAAVGKGQAWLAQVSRLARTSRGVKAGPMRRLYLATCVLRMLYAADVFLNPATVKARTADNRAVVTKLRTVQRRAALLITGGLSSSPTDVLDAYTGLIPMRHLINKMRYRAALRLATVDEAHPLY
jgi:hypothetical protein